MSKSLASVLRDVLVKYRLTGEVHRVKMPEYWRDTVGSIIARSTEVRGFENGVLRVHAREAVWRSEVMLRREDIRRRLNERIGEELVREIIVK